MIRPGNSEVGEQVARKRPKSPFHAIANHRIADFLGHGEADSHCAVAVVAMANQENEARHGGALAAIRGEEVGPFREGN
jgi:hypothetical protein